MTDQPDYLPSPAPDGSPYGRPVNEAPAPPYGQAPASPAPLPQVKTFPMSFTGDAAEFFRIWIVNVALTVVTLGFYLPWARVRTRQYFFGNTWVDGHNFEYTASPWALLRGYLLIGFFFGLYNAAIQIQFEGWMWVAGIIILTYAALYPWLVRQSMRFLARSTVHRGLHFSFRGSLGNAYISFGVANLAVIFFPAIPWIWFMQRRYQIDGVRYGQAQGRFRGEISPFYMIGLAGLGISVGGGILLVLMALLGMGVFAGFNPGDWDKLDKQSPVAIIGMVASMVLAYLGYILLYLGVWQYVRAALMKYVLNNVELGGVVRMSATFNPWTLVWITLTNTLAQMFTLGLMAPWAAVRRMKYITSHIQVRAIAELDDFTADVAGEESAVGEAATELLDIDIGF